MTLPPDGTQPAYGSAPPPNPYGQAGYPATPPPAYAAPGFPAPGYGAPAGAARPGMVTAAAVLCFIWGGFSIIGAFITMVGGALFSAASSTCGVGTTGDTELDKALGNVCSAASGAGGFLIVISIILIVAAALLIWGGVVAITGKNSKIGVIAGGLLILAQIVSLIASGGSGIGFAIFGLIVPVLIIVFLINANSKAWFKSKGGATF